MRRLLLSFAVLAVIPLLACSSSKSTPQTDGGNDGGNDAGMPPSIVSFTATPSSLPLGGGSVNLQWSVTGATSLSIDHGIGTVSGTSTNATVSATTVYTLSVTNAAGTSTQATTVAVASVVTVSGQVTYSDRTTIVPNAVVMLTGQAPLSADSGGHFSIGNVTPPYTLSAMKPGSKSVTIYSGLVRADPVLALDLIAPKASQKGSLAGQLSGACCTFSSSSADTTLIGFDSVDARSYTAADATSGTYTLSPTWPATAPSITTGNLYALQYACGGFFCSVPSAYSGFGSLPSITLSAGATASGQNFALAPVTTSHLAGTVVPASGYSVSQNQVLMVFPQGLAFYLVYDFAASSSFDYPIPSGTLGTFKMSPSATNSAGAFVVTTRSGISAGSSGISIAMPAAPTLSTPADAATLTAAPQFSWNGSTDQLFELIVKSSSPVQKWRVLTHATGASLPDLTALSMNLAPNVTYTWYVHAYSPIATLDAFSASGVLPTDINGSFGASSSQSFTTAP